MVLNADIDEYNDGRSVIEKNVIQILCPFIITVTISW